MQAAVSVLRLDRGFPGGPDQNLARFHSAGESARTGAGSAEGFLPLANRPRTIQIGARLYLGAAVDTA